jgi:glycine betaine/proline transport system substrate-binding protein
MLGKMFKPQRWGLIIGMIAVTLMAGACSSEPAVPTAVPKEVIRFHDAQWETNSQHFNIAMYITDHGYGYPVEATQGSTSTMLVTLPQGDIDVAMELWRNNIKAWYDENTANGKIVDLSGTADNLPNGSLGQIMENSAQGFYVPTFVIEANPGLVSVLDLPDYKHLFEDPEDPAKGVMVNCILGWQCQKIVRAKWYAYGLYDTYNVMEPGAAGAIDANINGAYLNNEPVLSYYWEPTKLISDLDMTMLEEPEWTEECQAALDIAVEDTPYESTIGCAFPKYDVHTGVTGSLVERAPEVTDFLAKMFIGALPLGDLATWKNENEKTWEEMTIYYLRNNLAEWSSWVSGDDVVIKVNEALALED